MAKRKVVGQTGNRNQSGSQRDAWTRKKSVATTITGKKKGQSEFLHSSGVNAVMDQMKKTAKRGTQVLRHTGYSEGNLAGTRISSVPGNRKMKNVELIMGVPGSNEGSIYNFGNRPTKEVKAWLEGAKAIFSDKSYAKLMRETGGKVHGALTLANRIMGLQIGTMSGTKLGNDFVTVSKFNDKGQIVSTQRGTRKSAGRKPAYGRTSAEQTARSGGWQAQQTAGTQVPNTPVVTPIAGQNKMDKETFKKVDTANLGKEQWEQMTSTQKFLTIAKMSSPNFKADKANAFAKQKELKAKNTARMIGVAGKAVSQVGYGISKGYQKGWNQR